MRPIGPIHELAQHDVHATVQRAFAPQAASARS
jgi:hypothetical protein